MAFVLQEPVPEPYRDRSSMLYVIGVVEILAGAAMVLGGVVVLLVPLMSHGGAPIMPASAIRMSALTSGFQAALLIGTGIGTLQCRRWARVFTVFAGWFGIATGVMGVAMQVAIIPRMGRVMAGKGPAPPAWAMEIGMLLGMAFTVAIWIVIPGLIVWGASSRDARMTCEWKDPVPRWTDRQPIAVTMAALWLATAAIMQMLVVAAQMALPVAGHFVTGFPAVAIAVSWSGVLLAIAGGLSQARLWAWGAALVTNIGGAVLGVITMLRTDQMELLQRLGWTEAQARQALELNPLGGHANLVTVVYSALPVLLLLLISRRHFFSATPAA